MNKITGIYQIRNQLSGKVYVGSSTDISRRWREHQSRLLEGTHHSKHLQSAWIKYGLENFMFEVLEKVEEATNLVTREQVWIDTMKSHHREFGYNSSPTAGSPLGFRHTEESKLKMSQTVRSPRPRTLGPEKMRYGRGYVYRMEYHFAWTVTDCHDVLEGEIVERLKVLIFDLGKQHGFGIEALEVMPDHVHVWVSATPQHFIPDMVKALKGATGRRILLEFPILKKRLWGRSGPEGAVQTKTGHLWSPSYFVATVSEVTREMVQRYIETQKERGGDSSGTEAESV